MPWIDFLDTYLDGRPNSELHFFHMCTCLYQLPYATMLSSYEYETCIKSSSFQSSSNNFMKYFCSYLYDAAHSWITDLEKSFNLAMIANESDQIINTAQLVLQFAFALMLGTTIKLQNPTKQSIHHLMFEQNFITVFRHFVNI